jgi:hypothetical protein
MEALLKKRAVELEDVDAPFQSDFKEHKGCGTIKDAKYDAAIKTIHYANRSPAKSSRKRTSDCPSYITLINQAVQRSRSIS